MPITVDVMRIPFVKEAFLEGEKRGEKKGEKKGEKRGEVAFLRRQLEQRFGELPAWASKKIAVADTAKLEKWSLQILDARTLKEALR